MMAKTAATQMAANGKPARAAICDVIRCQATSLRREHWLRVSIRQVLLAPIWDTPALETERFVRALSPKVHRLCIMDRKLQLPVGYITTTEDPASNSDPGGVIVESISTHHHHARRGMATCCAWCMQKRLVDVKREPSLVVPNGIRL